MPITAIAITGTSGQRYTRRASSRGRLDQRSFLIIDMHVLRSWSCPASLLLILKYSVRLKPKQPRTW